MNALVDVLESELDAQLFRGPKSLAAMLGWSSYHTLRSKGSRAGYPDRTCVKGRILFAELKREKTEPTRDQVEWLDTLSRAGGECYLWRPRDLDEIAKILGKPWRFEHGALRGSTPNTFWRPASLWIAGRGRFDSIEAQAA